MSRRPPPENFEPFPVRTGFIGHNGPLYLRRLEGRFDLGFWVEEQHCNPDGSCHGGWLASFADIQLAGIAYPHAQRQQIATISLTVDYLAAARLGVWVEGHAEVLRATRGTVFSQMTATADGKLCLRASGVFKI